MVCDIFSMAVPMASRTHPEGIGGVSKICPRHVQDIP
nr:MAG TPA: hypothetical protein [Caudoviricetes sp.]